MTDSLFPAAWPPLTWTVPCCSSTRFLSPRTRQALQKAHEKGVELVPATGRMLHFLPDLPDGTAVFLHYAITSNGAGVYDLSTGACLYANTFPPPWPLRSPGFFLSLDLWVECYVNGHAWIHRATLENGPDHYHLPQIKAVVRSKTVPHRRRFAPTYRKRSSWP